MKRWCCLFTSLSTRAVHFEVAHSLDAESCMAAVMRFTARRGKPRTILSDNGSNFVGAAREMREYIEKWNAGEMESNFALKQINGKFNPPSAPHFGVSGKGLSEAAKKTMLIVLEERSLSDELLQITMCIVEQTLNSRPMLPLSSDPQDFEALTPNHFLLGRPSNASP